jgi:hypothetical protein
VKAVVDESAIFFTRRSRHHCAAIPVGLTTAPLGVVPR